MTDKRIWYHGSYSKLPEDLTQLRMDRTRGFDQNENGPGWYFSSHRHDAEQYGPYLYKANFDCPEPKRVVSSTARLTIDDLLAITRPAFAVYGPTFLQDFVEDRPSQSMLKKILLQNYLQRFAVDSLILLYHDYFKYNATAYTQAVGKVFGGMICKRRSPVKHLIVFNPSCITLRKNKAGLYL